MAARTTPTVRKGIALLVGALVALCALPIVDAQAADPSVSLRLGQPSVSLDAANTTTLTATVTNGNAQLAGSVRMDVVAPEGWTVVADPLQFPLDAGASQDVTLTITAPDAGIGAATGDVGLTATITESAATARTDTATAAVAVERVDPLPPPPPPPAWFETPLGMAAIAVGILAVLGAAVGGFLWRRRQRQRLAEQAAAAAQAAYLDRETGITITRVDEPRAFGPKREVVFRVQLENVSARPRVAVVRVETPEGWTGAPSMPRIPLSAGEKSVLTVCVRPVAAEETGEVQVVAKPEEATERDERVRVDIRAPAARRIMPEEGPRVASPAPRETANQRAPPPPTTLKL